jgi:hypothetical protein
MAELEAEIRDAVARGDFAAAATLWNEWTRCVAGRIQSSSLTAPEWEQATRLYQWGRTVLLCERSHLQQQLNSAHAAEVYRSFTGANGAHFVTGDF